jgi:hypothetical protein
MKHIILDDEGQELWAKAKVKVISDEPKLYNLSDNMALKKILRGFLDEQPSTRK